MLSINMTVLGSMIRMLSRKLITFKIINLVSILLWSFLITKRDSA